MSSAAKFKGLPGIDWESKEVYETEDVEEEIEKPEETEQCNPDIVETPVSRSEAAYAVTGSAELNFSDSLAEFYDPVTQSFRIHKIAGLETPQARILRLEREIEELKLVESQGNTGKSDTSTVETLAKELQEVHLKLGKKKEKSGEQENSQEEFLGQELSNIAFFQEISTLSSDSKDSNNPTPSSIKQSQESQEWRKSAQKFIEVERKLAQLEQLIGTPEQFADLTDHVPLRLRLEEMCRKMEMIDTSSEAMTKVFDRIQELSLQAEKLLSTRNIADTMKNIRSNRRVVSGALAQAQGRSAPGSRSSSIGLAQQAAQAGELAEDQVSITKDLAKQIEELAKRQPQLESLAEALPLVTDRLKSLEVIHADAAGVVQRAKEVESKLCSVVTAIQGWDRTLTEVNTKIESTTAARETNQKTIEAWIKSLTDRITQLEANTPAD